LIYVEEQPQYRQLYNTPQLATQIDWSKTAAIWQNLMATRSTATGKHQVKAASAASASQVANQAISFLKTKAETNTF